MLGGGAGVELGDVGGEVGGQALGGPGALELLGEADERREGLPAVADGPGAGRRLRGEAAGGEDGADLAGEVRGVVGERVGAGPGGAAQQDAGVADLRPFEEPLGALELVGDAEVGEGLLVDLGLAVGAEEDGDLAGADSGGEELLDPAGGGLGLGRLVLVLGVDGLGAGLALGDEFEAVPGRLAAGLGEQPVREVDDLRGGAVVADQLDDRRLGVAGAEVEQVVRGGAGERVDGLAGVADDAEAGAAARSRPLVEEPLLEGETSWYSSTVKCRYWDRTWSAMSGRSSRMAAVSSSTSSKSITPRRVLASSYTR